MNLFKTLAMIGLVGVGMVAKGLCTDSEDADLKRWQEKAAAIKSGTPLAEVKRILGISPNAELNAYCSGPHCAGLVSLQSNIIACIDWQGGSDYTNDPVNHVSVRLGPVVSMTRPTYLDGDNKAVSRKTVEIKYLQQPPSKIP